MDIEQFRTAGYQAIDRICDYYYSIQDQPVVSSVKPGYLRELLPSEAPAKGEEFQNIADDYQKLIMPGLTHWQHPLFFAYFPIAGTFESMLAELYASSITNPGFNWACSPACTELEAVVMDWAAKLFALSPDFYNSNQVGGGVIQTSASDCALVAVVAARSRYLRQYPSTRLEDLVIYTTTQTHSIGTKAGLVLGLSVHAIPVFLEDNFSIGGHRLQQAIEEDLKLGKKPFIFIATLGTTSSGAVDNIDEVVQILQDHPSIWLHIDGAWAGATLSCPEYRERAHLSAINKYANSICINFHKWGLVNFDCSGMWVRDRKNLTDALDITPVFLRTPESDAGTVIDYRNWHLGLGRRFRSLKLWFVLRSFGVEGFQANIRKSIESNNHFVTLIQASNGLFELVTPPSYALSVFRIVATPTTTTTTTISTSELLPHTQGPQQSSLRGDDLNTLNRLFFQKISTRTDLMLTQTELDGIYCTRFAVGSTRTEKEHIEKAFSVLKEVAAASITEWQDIC